MLTDHGVVSIGALFTTNLYGPTWSNFLKPSDWHSIYPDVEFDYIGFDITTDLDNIISAHDSNWRRLFTLANGCSLCARWWPTSVVVYSYMDGNGTVYTQEVFNTICDQYEYMYRDSYTARRAIVFPIYTSAGKYGIGFICKGEKSSQTWINIGVEWSTLFQPVITGLLNGQPMDVDDPYITANDDNPSGGFGSFDYTSEVETPPSLPSLSAANAGFVTLWNPTIGEVGSLADYLWGPTFSVASWQKLWNDPMECLLSLGIVPVAPTTGTRSNIYFGNADTGIESAPITTQFVSVDMGSIHIDGQSASYMDYAPYAKASIYLPYCGTYALDVDEIMDADLALEYHIDIYTGACVAYLTINNRTNSDGSVVHNVMYQFTGNCLASIPVTSGDHSQLLQSLLFMGASIAATVATAGAGAASGGAIEGLAAEGDVVASSGVLGAATAGSAINTVMSMKPNVMHSGNLSSTAGLLGGQKPFVTFTWSNLCRPEGEYKLVGMPVQKSGTLSDFEGFTIVSACHMDNILCTDAERSMIEQALGRGVII